MLVEARHRLIAGGGPIKGMLVTDIPKGHIGALLCIAGLIKADSQRFFGISRDGSVEEFDGSPGLLFAFKARRKMIIRIDSENGYLPVMTAIPLVGIPTLGVVLAYSIILAIFN